MLLGSILLISLLINKETNFLKCSNLFCNYKPSKRMFQWFVLFKDHPVHLQVILCRPRQRRSRHPRHSSVTAARVCLLPAATYLAATTMMTSPSPATLRVPITTAVLPTWGKQTEWTDVAESWLSATSGFWLTGTSRMHDNIKNGHVKDYMNKLQILWYIIFKWHQKLKMKLKFLHRWLNSQVNNIMLMLLTTFLTCLYQSIHNFK